MKAQALRVGEFEVTGLAEGYFYLDGGAMFGVVPKTLWERKAPADALNRIRLSLNSLLVKTPKALVLIETGIGMKASPKLRDLYEIHLEPGLLPALRELGVRPEDVDFVVNSHLHFDHCGGNTVIDERGKTVPAFPRARYAIQKGEWNDALRPSERSQASYLKENFEAVGRAGQTLFVEGRAVVTDGVEVFLTPGHTRFHQSVRISSMDETLIYLGDLVPMSAHIGLPYIMSYDLYPLETLETKKKVYELAIAGNWTLAFVHDPVRYFGKVTRSGTKYQFQPLGAA
jgi:glyoxylase-like metal-dependent hydrolase (beta-lactamase superfamily II)